MTYRKSLFKAALPILLMIILISGCSKKSEVDLDLQAIADKLLAEVAFDDTLYSVDASMLTVLVGVDGESVSEAVLYAGTGATAEEIVLLKFSDDSEAETGYSQLESHLESQKSDFENYVPAEVARIDHAVLVQEGTYVLLCVSSDAETVTSIFEDASAE